MSVNENIIRSFTPNINAVKNLNKGQLDVRGEEAFKSRLMEVGINEGLAEQIDQFYFNELANSNLDPMERDWALRYLDLTSDYLLASTTNPTSRRKYDCTVLILKAYERCRSLVITSKSKNGWAFENILKQRHDYTLNERKLEEFREAQKKGFFGNNPAGEIKQ